MSSVGLADHYGRLEVERDADEAAIKKSYRRLVLQWHPDKHKENREAAEDKIREINDAYETLSNPFKRSQYDQQVLALERKARGVRLDTTAIKPRMSIPKEFMLCPMGHPEKFVRVAGMSVFVQSRVDVKAEFYDFFREAKFSLWWLPEVNNMCRLRPTTTAGVGVDGGLNFVFALSRQVQVSEINLNPSVVAESTNVIAVASPVFQRAFRFEAANYPGHYLAYKPPTHLRMVGGIVDETTVIDFVLVDYAQMYNYITMEEVLRPSVAKLGGEKDFVPLGDVREHHDVAAYFNNVLKKVWTDDDFETFFTSRSGEWDYDSKRAEVRLRSKHEQLGNSLRRSRNLPELAAAISTASDYDCLHLPIDTLEAMLVALALQPPAGTPLGTIIHIMDAQKKILVAIPKACEKNVSFRRLLSIYKHVSEFGGEKPEASILKWRGETCSDLGDLLSREIKRSRSVSDHIDLSVLKDLFDIPLSWKNCSERLAKIADRVLEREKLDVLLPYLQAVVKNLPASMAVAERVANLARRQLSGASPEHTAAALEAMVGGGLCLEHLARGLERILKSAPFDSVASILAGLGERSIEGDDMKACARYVGKEQESLEALPPSLLLRLVVASTKSVVVAEAALDAVASAVAMTLPGWCMDDASKMLLAVAKAKAGTSGSGVNTLYSRSSEVLSLKVTALSPVQLIKVVLAIIKVAECRPLLDAAMEELTDARLGELPQAQLQLLTQGLLALEVDDPHVAKIFDYWTFHFNDEVKKEHLMGPEFIPDRRADLQAKGQLTADQLAKLASSLAPKVPEHQWFWKAFGRRFIGEGDVDGLFTDLTASGKAIIEKTFGNGAGPNFEGKASFLRACRGEKDKEKERKDKRAKAGKDSIQESASSSSSESESKRKRRRKERDKEYDKPLLLAAENGRFRETQTLLKAKAQVDQLSSTGCSALHLAAQGGHIRVCDALLSAGANVNLKGTNGFTALHFAAGAGASDVCTALLHAKAEVNAQHAEGGTPLHIAASNGCAAVCAVLVGAKASASIPDSKGVTPLDIMKKDAQDKEKAKEEEEEKRRQQRERRSKAIEEREKAKVEEQKKKEEEEEKRRLMRQRRKKLNEERSNSKAVETIEAELIEAVESIDCDGPVQLD